MRLFGPSIPPTVAMAAISGGAVDPLSVLDDTFDGTGDIENYGWSWYKEAAVTGQTLSGGELDLTISAGGTGVGGTNSFWFDGTNDGILLYKTITGPFDARLRCRVRNTADSGNPPVDNFRIAGLAAHDPTRTSNVFNYVHIGAGSAGQADNRIEWKTTDDGGQASNDTSAFNSASWGASLLNVDLRMVRRSSNTQIFDLYWRATTGSLLDNSGWTSLVTVNRGDNTAPDRDTNGALANLAQSMPNTLQVGLIIYCNTATHNVRMHAQEFRVRTTTA